MNTQDDFQILRDERTKLVNEIADLQTENLRLREAIKAAMTEIAKGDCDEAYHLFYGGLDPNFEQLNVHS